MTADIPGTLRAIGLILAAWCALAVLAAIAWARLNRHRQR